MPLESKSRPLRYRVSNGISCQYSNPLKGNTIMSYTTTATPATNTFVKAAGFLNFYLPSKDGKRRKVGAIGLKDSKPQEKSLREWLEADAGNMTTFMEKVIIEYQSAEPTEGHSFDLQ